MASPVEEDINLGEDKAKDSREDAAVEEEAAEVSKVEDVERRNPNQKVGNKYMLWKTARRSKGTNQRKSSTDPRVRETRAGRDQPHAPLPV